MKNILAALLLTALITFPCAGEAADKPTPEKAAASVRALPFRGKIVSVDKQANTLKVGERIFQLSEETRIIKAGKPASLEDATVGEDVGGSYREGTDKKLNLVSLRIGAKPEDKK